MSVNLNCEVKPRKVIHIDESYCWHEWAELQKPPMPDYEPRQVVQFNSWDWSFLAIGFVLVAGSLWGMYEVIWG